MIEGIKNRLRQVLNAAPDGRLMGAVLGNRFRTAEGRAIREIGKELGFEDLKAFVKTYMSDEVTIVESESDSIFELIDKSSIAPEQRGEAKPFSPETSPEEVQLFRLWRSPRNRFSLAVGRADGAVRVISRHEVVGDDEVKIEPTTAVQHDQIARRFLDKIPEQHREAFESAIDTEKPRWWEDWNPLFQEHAPHQRGEWLRFREHALVELLQKTLSSAGLSDTAVSQALQTILRSRRLPNATKPLGTDRRALRDAILATIGVMSDEEISRLWVPAGLFYEALKKGR